MENAEIVESSEPENPEGSSESPTTEETTQEAIEAFQRLKLKVDGKEQEVVYKTEEELIRDVQKARAADARFQEAARLRKQVEGLVGKLRNQQTLLSALEELGYSPEMIDKMAEARVARRLDEELMDPKERELKQLRQEAEARKRALEAQETERAIQVMDYKIRQALSQSDLPKTAAMYDRMIFALQTAHENGYELEPADIVPFVEKSYQEELGQALQQVGPEKLKNVIGEQAYQKLFGTPAAHPTTPDVTGSPSGGRGARRPEKRYGPDNLAELVRERLGE